MDVAAKLHILADAAKYDASCASSGSNTKRSGKGIGSTEGGGICHSYTPDGRCISLLKILLTNHCIFDCKYCTSRVSSDVPRARFTTKEVVDLTLDFYRRNYIEGLFLSSGIIRDSDYTMGQLTAVAKSLREEHGFRGYIHLKTIPGASDELVQEAGLYADRVSVNIELPTAEDLSALAPEKNRPQLENNMKQIKLKSAEIQEDKKKGLKPPVYAPAGQSTQIIVGATKTADKDILGTANTLYNQYRLRRVYYSAFSPIPHADARLPGKSPPLIREHRLYQADWMLRFYGFSIGEIVDDAVPDLSLDVDPKTAWALRHRDYFPVDVNRADREKLLRIPGMGVRSVDQILKIRKFAAVKLQDLVKLRVAMNRALPFLIAADYNSAPVLLDAENLRARFAPPPEQLSLAV
jgi:putative DNA modification/repair radical SAM protein